MYYRHVFQIAGEPVVSFIIPVEGSKDEFIIGTGKRVTLIKWDGKCDKATVVGTVGKYKKNYFKAEKQKGKHTFVVCFFHNENFFLNFMV